MLTATEANPTPTTPDEPAPEPAFVELTDEEILAWLTASVLDEPDPGSVETQANGDDGQFWDNVAAVQAELSGLGYSGARATQCAIAVVGLELEALAEPVSKQDALTHGFSRLGEEQLQGILEHLMRRATDAMATLFPGLGHEALRKMG